MGLIDLTDKNQEQNDADDDGNADNDCNVPNEIFDKEIPPVVVQTITTTKQKYQRILPLLKSKESKIQK